MAIQPSGTVTLLFTDIEDSTRLLQMLGTDRYAVALEDHRRLLRTAFAEHGGYEVDCEGDSFFVAFASATEALTAAEAVQRALDGHDWPEELKVRVRIGLHTGEPQVAAPRYVGLDVHVAARVMGAAHGGQVLLTETTRELVGSSFSCRDVGEHRLKDLPGQVHLYQLTAAGLGAKFPHLRTLVSQKTNLPALTRPLVGRTRELEQLRSFVANPASRLITCVGPGGVGKSRLALHAAVDTQELFADGVFLVQLASIRDPELVPQAIADTLAVREHPNEPLLETLVEYLTGRELLLLLDNFEQIVAAAPSIVTLLERAPRLKLIVTSRARLHVAAEHVLSVRPLDIPPPDADHRSLREYSAAGLFLERIAAADPDFSLDAESAAAVRGICARVDGLPLALELAAARANVLTAKQILDRLEQRRDLLTGGGGDAPDRQKALRTTIGWSYDLLDQNEKVLFTRLSVFTGGCSLAAAEEICDAELDVLASLVDKSLVLRRGERFLMLETIREYALELLDATSEAAALRLRHAEHFLAQVDREDVIRSPRAVASVFASDYPNLRAGLAWTIDNAPDVALRLAAMLWSSWGARGMLIEGRNWLDRALCKASDERCIARTQALIGDCWLAHLAGDRETCRRRGKQALALARTLEAPRLEVAALNALGSIASIERMDAEARRLLGRAVAVARRCGDDQGLAAAVGNLGTIAHREGHWDDAITLYSEEIALLRDASLLETTPLVNLGLAELQAGRDPASAAKRFDDALRHSSSRGDTLYAAIALWGLGLAIADLARADSAVRVIAAATAWHEAIGYTIDPFDRALQEATVGRLRTRLGDDGFAAAWADGAKLEANEAISHARDAFGVATAPDSLAFPA